MGGKPGLPEENFLAETAGELSLDMSSSAELTSDNYSNTRQFNSLKSFKSHRNRQSYI